MRVIYYKQQKPKNHSMLMKKKKDGVDGDDVAIRMPYKVMYAP